MSEEVKLKCSRYRPGVAQRLGRGIALLFHDRGTRRDVGRGRKSKIDNGGALKNLIPFVTTPRLVTERTQPPRQGVGTGVPFSEIKRLGHEENYYLQLVSKVKKRLELYLLRFTLHDMIIIQQGTLYLYPLS